MVSIAMIGAGTCPVSAATVYVDQASPNPEPPYSTPATAAHGIQDAVDVTTNGDTVVVEPGTYNLTNQITVTNGILLESSGGAGQTILSAQTNFSGPTNVWCLWVSNSDAVVDGFTIQCPSGSEVAAATFVADGTVQNCDFTNYTIYTFGSEIVMGGGVLSNSTVCYLGGPSGNGSAIYCYNGSLVTDCRILNSGKLPETKGIYLEGSTVTNSLICGSHYVAPGGGGPALYAISSSIIHCTITNSWSQGPGPGGGAFLDSSFMDRCTIIGNRLYGVGPGYTGGGAGGGGVFETNSIIRDSLIVSNIAQTLPDTGVGAGGGVSMQGGMLINCTVSGNSAYGGTNPAEGSGVYVESGGITNSVIYFNYNNFPPAEGEWFNVGSGVFDHCCTTPDPGGIGNITQDPRFVDATNGDFHLAPDSPCIGAGIVQPWMTGAEDLDGYPRTVPGAVDMGAYEHQAPDPPLVVILNPRWADNVFSFNFPTQTNHTYAVQWTYSMAPVSWQVLTNFAGDGATMAVTNVDAVAPARFYRVVVQ